MRAQYCPSAGRSLCGGILFCAVASGAVWGGEKTGERWREARLIVNWDEEEMFRPLLANQQTAQPDAQVTKRLLEEIIDEHAAVHVDVLVHCVFGAGFREHVPNSRLADLLGGDMRRPELDQAGLDFLQIVLDRCRKDGIDFVAGFRMNDRHGLPPTQFVRDHPEWALSLGGGAMDYAQQGVRDHVLACVAEVLDRYDVDGVEFDYMRWCHMFKPGEGTKNAALLTAFMQETRKLLDAAATRRGRGRLAFGVRVPQTLAECAFLGFDVAAWIKGGLVDWVVPADFFFTDFNMKTEDFVALAAGTNCLIYPAIMPLSCWNGNARPITLANYRAAVNNYYAFGAAGFSPYNYQVHWHRRSHPDRGPWVDPVQWPAALGYLWELRDANRVAQGDRHYLYFALWQDRASETGSPKNPRIMLDRAQQDPAGNQRFRAAEDFSNTRLRGTLQFKAVGLRQDERLEILLNDAPVPAEYVTRVAFPDGQSELQGVKLPAFHLFAVDLNWAAPKPPLIFGDNRITVRLVHGPESNQGVVTIDELELYVYVRPSGRTNTTP
jgi:hypothetical protein